VVAYLERGRVRLKTRAGNDATARFAPITDLLAKLPVRSAVLDGRDRGAGCARRHQPRSARPGAPRSRRAAALAELLKKVPDRILYSDDLAGDGAALFAKIGELGGSPAKPGD